MRTIGAAAFLLALLMASGPAAGPLRFDALNHEQKGWFYNRPNVTLEGAAQDIAACRQFASAMIAETQNVRIVPVWIGTDARRYHVMVDTCMIGRGYRRYDTTDSSLAEFETRFGLMNAADRSALIGEEAPIEGTLARQWANSLWLHRSGDDLAPSPRPPVAAWATLATSSSQFPIRRPLREGASVALRDGEALLLITLRLDVDPGMPAYLTRQAGYVSFVRESDSERPSWLHFSAEGRPGREQDPYPRTTTRKFVVPAGTYALSAAGAVVGPGLEHSAPGFCIGTVALRAEAGSILDLGEWVVRPVAQAQSDVAPAARFGLRVNMRSVEEGRALMSGYPDLAARLAPAVYYNGYAAPCLQITDMYGFDIPGAPLWSSSLAQRGQAP
jgi:hypothetical protein